MLLGDAYMRVINKDPKHTVGGFWIEHSRTQMDYLLWKKEQIEKVFVTKNLPQRCKIYTRDRYDKRTNKTYLSCILNLNWKSYLENLNEKVYRLDFQTKKTRKNTEYLLNNISSDKHLAIWFMDDGSESKTKAKHKDGIQYWKNPYFRLATQSLKEGEINLIIEWFKSKYGVSPTKTKQRSGWIIQFSVKDSKTIFPRFRPYVNQIESMRHKFSLCLERY
jgi:hypothetical protein